MAPPHPAVGLPPTQCLAPAIDADDRPTPVMTEVTDLPVLRTPRPLTDRTPAQRPAPARRSGGPLGPSAGRPGATRPTRWTGRGREPSTTQSGPEHPPRHHPPGDGPRDHACPARRRDRIPSSLVKLMYAAWGDDLPRPTPRRRLHQRLAAAGVRRLQLNLDDEDVAPAMRIATGRRAHRRDRQRLGRRRTRGGHARRWRAATTSAGRLGGRRAAPDPAAGVAARRTDGRARQRRGPQEARRPRPRRVAAPVAGRPHPDRDRHAGDASATSRTS